jgi:hypothetical protein
MDPQEPRLFETLTLPNVAALCFVIRVADSKIKPELVPTPGTAYSACLLPTRTAVQEWGTYVYGWPLEAPAGYSAFAFVPSLPTTPVVTPRLDPIWGSVLDHTYYCLRSSTQLDVADTSTTIAVLGAAYTSRHVIEVRPPREMSGEVIEVTVTTAASNTVTQTDKLVDEETGALFTQTKTYTAATTNPTGAATDANGLFTEARQQSHRLWLSVTRPANLIGIGYANRRTYETQEALYWPAVMTDFQMLTVLSQVTDPSLGYFKRIPVWRMLDAFSDPVKCIVSEWWQQSAPTWGSGGLPTPGVTMQPSACRITGNLMSLSIPECLHAAVEYQEQNAIVPGNDFDPWITVNLRMISFSWAATNYTVWPATFTKVFSKPQNGGYLCRSEVYHRPTVSGGELSVNTSTTWSLESHGYWYALR